MVRPDVTPDSPLAEQPTIGLIGMGAMGKMYAKHLSAAGWKKYETILEFETSTDSLSSSRIMVCDQPQKFEGIKRDYEGTVIP